MLALLGCSVSYTLALNTELSAKQIEQIELHIHTLDTNHVLDFIDVNSNTRCDIKGP